MEKILKTWRWTMKNNKSYSRKISSKEAKNEFIFVLKNKLSFFPPIGNRFTLTSENYHKEVEVESYPCTCRGPDLPHEHYFIHWKGLKKGDKIKISKNSENYILEIN